MEYDKDKVDDMVLALLYLTLHDDNRAWKAHDWDALNRLHEKGMIGDPVGKAKSVWLTDEGLRRSRELCMQHFTRETRLPPNETRDQLRRAPHGSHAEKRHDGETRRT